MRISDWSSDVCSSDLEGASGRNGQGGEHRPSRTTHPRNLPTERDPAMHTHPRHVQITALALGIAGAMAFSQAPAPAFLLQANRSHAPGRSIAGAPSAKGAASAIAADTRVGQKSFHPCT